MAANGGTSSAAAWAGAGAGAPRLQLAALLLGAPVILLLLLLCPGASSQALVRVPIDWANVPTTPAAKNLTAGCACDLTLNECDVGCCCDPDCASGLTELFTSNSRCLPEGVNPNTLTYCVGSSIMNQVRAEWGLWWAGQRCGSVAQARDSWAAG